MSALTANGLNLTTREIGAVNRVATAAAVLYIGAFVMRVAAGTVQPLGTATGTFDGVAITPVSAAATVRDLVVSRKGLILKTIAGVAASDLNALVYSDNDNDVVLNKPANGKAIGWIVDFEKDNSGTITGAWIYYDADFVAWQYTLADNDFSTGGLLSDVIAESTGAAGVTVDGVLCKDGGIVCADGAAIEVDTVSEATAAAGVTADGVLLKDGGIVCADGAAIEVDTVSEATAAAGVTIDGMLIKDKRINVAGLSTGEAGVTVKDNVADAFSIKEATNAYLTVVTTNNKEQLAVGKPLVVGVQTVDMANAAHALVRAAAGAGETLLTGNVIFVDPNGGAQILTLPAVADSAGVVLDIVNTADAAETITVKDVATATIVSIAQNKAARVACNGSAWRAIALLG